MAGVKRKAKPSEPWTGPIFEPGETVLVIRPNIWSGSTGVVISVKDGIHRVSITKMPDRAEPVKCHADIPGDQLEIYL